MAVIELTIKIPGCCAECQWYHCDKEHSFEGGEEYDIYCDLDDVDGNVSFHELDDSAWDVPGDWCPLVRIAEMMKVEMPKPDLPDWYKKQLEEDNILLDKILEDEDYRPEETQ